MVTWSFILCSPSAGFVVLCHFVVTVSQCVTALHLFVVSVCLFVELCLFMVNSFFKRYFVLIVLFCLFLPF